MEPGWPSEVLLIRHAESAGNVARERARERGDAVIALEWRDCDVPLSPAGEAQATALGRWLAKTHDPFDAFIASPYVRAHVTATRALEAAGWNATPVLLDERLREKEFGVLDRLTQTGIAATYPDEAEMRRVLGKFYYRPPGGESWTDVILRVRGFIESMLREHPRRRIAIVAHQVIVLCFRYVVEQLTEAEILAIDRAGDVANAAVTAYRYDAAGDRLELVTYNETAPLEETGAPVTVEPDVPVARN